MEQGPVGTLLADAPASARDDGELIAAVRAGDTEAYGELFARHADAARRIARSMTDPIAADDLVSEAFTKVLVVLQRGGGPDLAFRPYLLTAVRRLGVDGARGTKRTRPTDDQAVLDPAAPLEDSAVSGFEKNAAARALASLPERWQAVLWHTEVEGQKPADIAPLLGMSPNAVAALAYRAREGLRQAFLTMHVEDAGEEACATARAHMGAYIRGGLSRREAAKLAAHIESCRPCAAIYLELVEANGELRGLLAPIVLGSAAAAYLGGASGFSLSGLFAGMLKPVAGVAAAGVAAGGLVLAIGTYNGGDDPSARGEGRADRVVDVGKQPRAQQKKSPGIKRPQSQTSTAEGPGAAPEPAQAATGHPSPSSPSSPDPSLSAGGHGSGPTGTPSGAAGNASVAASATSGTGLEWDVQVRVAGLASAETATLTISADHPTVNLQLDPACDPVGAGDAVCRIQGSTTLRMVVLPDPTTRTTVTFTLTPGPGVEDSESGDNVARVTLAR